jgi:large subunit ribosomal protein L9
MEVILLQEVKGLGEAGATVTVADGYARNFLLPRKLALATDRNNLRQREHHRRLIAQSQQQEVNSAETLAQRLGGITLRLEAQAGEAGRLHGTITAADVAAALAEQHELSLDRHAVSLPEPIKVLGTHEAKIRLHREVEATIKLEVVPRAEGPG